MSATVPEYSENELPGLNDTMFARPPVYARRSDLPELQRIAAQARGKAEAALFLQEFARLSVAPETGEPSFVHLGAWVAYRDLRTKRQRRVRVVRPGSENPEENEVSLLSPIGAALVGLAQGAIFRWQDTGGGSRAVRVLEIAAAEAG
jgi:regulator of nucleoside diphosphate kinase